MAQIWPLSPVRRREWPVCGARVCGEQDSGRSTLRFTILPRAALFEKAICSTTTCGRQQRCTQRIGTRDPRPAEASRSLAMRGLFHTPAARDSDMHVASMSLQNTTRDGVQPRRWRFVYFTPQERMLRASGRCACCIPDSTSRVTELQVASSLRYGRLQHVGCRGERRRQRWRRRRGRRRAFALR